MVNIRQAVGIYECALIFKFSGEISNVNLQSLLIFLTQNVHKSVFKSQSEFTGLHKIHMTLSVVSSHVSVRIYNFLQLQLLDFYTKFSLLMQLTKTFIQLACAYTHSMWEKGSCLKHFVSYQGINQRRMLLDIIYKSERGL